LEDLYETIRQCAANNRVGQEKLYRKFYPAMMLLCKRFFADDHVAMETVNDGMMKVYRNIGSYDPGKGDFFNWVYTIVRNAALDKLKLNKWPRASPLNGIAEQSYTDNPLKTLEEKDIYFLLDTLAPGTRAVCSLFYLEGFPIKDICEQLEISAGTVKWHLSETRKKLKPVLEKYYS
jgi:RNA polymerase sigma factor (sigma-70 family)